MYDFYPMNVELKLIERCEVVILEKLSVSDAKKQLYLTRNAKVR